MAALRVPAQAAGLVIPDIETDDEIRRKADEPEVLCIAGGAGLAGDRLTHLAQRYRGAALHHPFHHRGDLIGGGDIKYLLAAVDELRLGGIFSARPGNPAPAFPR